MSVSAVQNVEDAIDEPFTVKNRSSFAHKTTRLYENAICLAPMVRGGTLPLRLLSLRYGADLVYSEEIIDKKILATKRIVNPVLNTIDYVLQGQDTVVFRTCQEERSKIVFQMGTCDPLIALKAAKLVARDVAAIDINMGCPKHFSIQGGMGAALLQKSQLAADIIKTLKQNLEIPVSCKIRVLDSADASMEFARHMEKAGADAIGVHGRQIHHRPVDPAEWDAIKPIVSNLTIPVLANGDLFSQKDIEQCRVQTGASSFLIARGALRNASIFRKEGMLPINEVVMEYLKIAADFENVFQNTKYNVSQMLPSKCDPTEIAESVVSFSQLGAAKNSNQLYALWNLEEYYSERQKEFQAKSAILFPKVGDSDPTAEHATENSFPAPKYDDSYLLKQNLFCSVCTLQLSSEKDAEQHVKGKRHKRKARMKNSGAFIAATMLQPELKRHKCDADEVCVK